ncbi:hypothetical protein V6N12_058117 [Hibiscus sabdariffa]|uniref:Late embryogenesis abundant protein LEA-2 subgroup domain-containing protein n=1 Tax=Hibiscus sabdariffa TaxID=183260 RepID=A0ABR2ARA6_9ROSI
MLPSIDPQSQCHQIQDSHPAGNGGRLSGCGVLPLSAPSSPWRVIHAHLDPLRLDYAGVLQIQATIQIRAQNGNEKAHASFSDSNYTLSLNGEDIARLVALPFEVSKNSWVDFNYLVESSPIPLDPEQAENVDMALKHDHITLGLKGSSRVRWRVGRLGSVRFLCHLDCHLHFHPLNGTYIPSRCTSNAK